MPPHKPNRFEVELRKNLEVSQGELDRVLEERNQFGAEIASLTEKIATLEQQAGESDKLREICKQLGGEVLELKARLEKEKEVEGKYREFLSEAIQNTAKEHRKLEIGNLFLRETCKGLERQNAAIRMALKEVL